MWQVITTATCTRLPYNAIAVCMVIGYGNSVFVPDVCVNVMISVCQGYIGTVVAIEAMHGLYTFWLSKDL